MIDPSSVVIGHVTLGDDVSIWPLVAIRGDVNRVHVGARTNIQDGCVLHVTHCSERNPVGHPWLSVMRSLWGIKPCCMAALSAIVS
ncbi:Carnitine operon protein CaiE [Sodalis praecaptivus]